MRSCMPMYSIQVIKRITYIVRRSFEIHIVSVMYGRMHADWIKVIREKRAQRRFQGTSKEIRDSRQNRQEQLLLFPGIKLRALKKRFDFFQNSIEKFKFLRLLHSAFSKRFLKLHSISSIFEMGKIQRVARKPRFDVDRRRSRAKSHAQQLRRLETTANPLLKARCFFQMHPRIHFLSVGSPNLRNYSCTKLFSLLVVYLHHIHARDSVISMNTCASQIIKLSVVSINMCCACVEDCIALILVIYYIFYYCIFIMFYYIIDSSQCFIVII